MKKLKNVNDLADFVEESFDKWNMQEPLRHFQTFKAKLKNKPVKITFEDANEYDNMGEIIDVLTGVNIEIGDKKVISSAYGESGIEELPKQIKKLRDVI
jgi:hypothetical protein